MSVFVIAEAGVNHNGDADRARRMIDAAAEAGPDAVKFQTFRAEELAAAGAPKAGYQEAATGTGESQLEMLKGLELTRDAFRDLAGHCQSAGIRFMSTAFDADSLDFLVGELAMEIVKIPSGEITNGPLLLRAGQSGKRIVLSTGMSDMDEIEAALGVLAFGLTGASGAPGREAFARAFASAAGRAALKDKVTILQCTSEYPAPAGRINLRAMHTMADRFGLAVGLSDHSAGTAVSIAAAALGATVIEKHFTLDRSLPGPDHAASLEPGELTAMVAAIREVEAAMGDGVKAPGAAERENAAAARR
ncbi:MAG: N-acetylneuraminate synthase family protein, partial [Rickettsiales bacterium]